jgi:hypothetical protein
MPWGGANPYALSFASSLRKTKSDEGSTRFSGALAVWILRFAQNDEEATNDRLYKNRAAAGRVLSNDKNRGGILSVSAINSSANLLFV